MRYQAASTGNGQGVNPLTGLEDVVITTEINSLGAGPNFAMKVLLQLAADGSVRVEKLSETCHG